MSEVTAKEFVLNETPYISFCLGQPTTLASLVQEDSFGEYTAKLRELEATLDPRLKDFDSQLLRELSVDGCMGLLPSACVLADVKHRKDEFLKIQPEYEEICDLHSAIEDLSAQSQYEFPFEEPYCDSSAQKIPVGDKGVLLLRPESMSHLRDHARGISHFKLDPQLSVGYIAQVEILQHERGQGLVDLLLGSVTRHSKELYGLLYGLVEERNPWSNAMKKAFARNGFRIYEGLGATRFDPGYALALR